MGSGKATASHGWVWRAKREGSGLFVPGGRRPYHARVASMDIRLAHPGGKRAMPSIDAFLTEADRQAIRAPIEEACTFPQVAYRSQEFFELEVERLFSRNWVAVGFGGSLPEPGDAAPLEIFGMPLLLMRGDDGAIRVFHN